MPMMKSVRSSEPRCCVSARFLSVGRERDAVGVLEHYTPYLGQLVIRQLTLKKDALGLGACKTCPVSSLLASCAGPAHAPLIKPPSGPQPTKIRVYCALSAGLSGGGACLAPVVCGDMKALPGADGMTGGGGWPSKVGKGPAGGETRASGQWLYL